MNINKIIEGKNGQTAKVHSPAEFMTAKEIGEFFGYKEETIKKHFDRTVLSIQKKYGVNIVKSKQKGETVYQIFDFEKEAKPASTIYDEEEDIQFPVLVESLSFESYEFLVFVALSASPQGVYRGTRTDLLKYLGVNEKQIDKKHKDKLDEVIDSLVKRGYIVKHEDQDVIIIYIKNAIEQKYFATIGMLKECRKIANENNKQFTKIAQLFQVWLAIRICEEHQPFTYAELVKMTGLSYDQVRDVKRLLEKNEIFRSNRVVEKKSDNSFQCLGMNVDLNGIFDRS